MALSKSKCWYSNNCSHFSKCALSIFYATIKFKKVKAGLHDGNYRSKLVHFEAQKIFSIIKKLYLSAIV